MPGGERVPPGAPELLLVRESEDWPASPWARRWVSPSGPGWKPGQWTPVLRPWTVPGSELGLLPGQVLCRSRLSGSPELPGRIWLPGGTVSALEVSFSWWDPPSILRAATSFLSANLSAILVAFRSWQFPSRLHPPASLAGGTSQAGPLRTAARACRQVRPRWAVAGEPGGGPLHRRPLHPDRRQGIQRRRLQRPSEHERRVGHPGRE